MATARPFKRKFVESLDGNDDDVGIVYRFQILLPNGTTVRLALHEPGQEIPMDDFIYAVRKEAEKSERLTGASRRKVLWNEAHLVDMSDNKIQKKICFNHYRPNKCHMLKLHDGVGESAKTFLHMWDLTPNTDLLAELPAEYTFETALADLIDNSLQAVWSNGSGERRLIRVIINELKIIILDTGQGMDDSDENSITKWGKMGSSNNRASRIQAIGDKAPYLVPAFGMFGYGGPIASMHLGKTAIVSSKTKESTKVYILHLSREALLNQSKPQCSWRTDGGLREPLEGEIRTSPHGSFTKVVIKDLRKRCLDIFKLQCWLKDIYFPYIQCDEGTSRRTTMPIQFEVNDTNLAEIQSGEVAVTNLHSCNGPDFVLQVKFLIDQEDKASNLPVSRKANARLKCVYFPIIEGKENIERIVEELDEKCSGTKQTFENFSRVSIRRLGRLLPDSRWHPLPFMESRQKKGDKAHLLKRCCKRVKCFVETDAGFSPTPSKTDLAHHDGFTVALRNFGHKLSQKESEAVVEIYRDGRHLNISQLEKEYQEWITDMHYRYDEEIDCGEDEPVHVIGPQDKKKLGITADGKDLREAIIVRVHQAIRRKGAEWKSGNRIKILKGAVGCTKNNYATLEYILVEGFQGDVGGEARLICRPIGCPEEQGCLLLVENGNARIDIRKSLSFPLNLIDTEKIQVIDIPTWTYQLQKQKEKLPSSIDILNREQCSILGIDGELPVTNPLLAGHPPPTEIVAVIRPAKLSSTTSPSSLDQKYIVRDELEMSCQIKYTCGSKGNQRGSLSSTECVKPSSRNGYHGLYIFSLRDKYPNLFNKSGIYIFSFSASCSYSTIKHMEARVTVEPDARVCEWRFLSNKSGPLTDKPLIIRVGSYVPYISIACLDCYSNQIPFSSVPEVIIKVFVKNILLAYVDKIQLARSSDFLLLEIKDMLIESQKLDLIRPNYDALLEIRSLDGHFSATIPCKVMPGNISSVNMQIPTEFEKLLAPGRVVEELLLEMFDRYGNHVEEGTYVFIQAQGFCFQDCLGSTRKVNCEGSVNLSGLLKVDASYGSNVFVKAFSGSRLIFQKEFQIAKKELRAVSGVHDHYISGSGLENVVFEVTDSDGLIDDTIHGPYHTLTLKSLLLGMDDKIQYTFHHGRCTVPYIPVPKDPGPFSFLASHTHYPDLCTAVEVYVMQAPKLEIVALSGSESSDTRICQSKIPYDEIPLLQDPLICTSSQMNLLVSYILDHNQKLDEKVSEVGLVIKEQEDKLKTLNLQKTQITKEINDLQESMGPSCFSHIDLLNTKQEMAKKIENKTHTAAAVFCHLSKAVQRQEPPKQFKHLMQDFVGVVALLGTVGNEKLSRILSQFVGECNMLGIVCNSHEAASRLEEYSEDGSINYQRALHKSARTLGITINNQFQVICLEEIRPYKGQVERNPQKKLILSKPLMQDGKVPAGFLGYAVNMIDLDIQHLNTRTLSGYGLRETLFYLLFGKIQVYRTRSYMRQASFCIKQGAISLDGGIMRNNGVIVLGDCEPDVLFPVGGYQSQRVLRPEEIETRKLLEEKKILLEKTNEAIEKGSMVLETYIAKFRKRSKQLNDILEKQATLLPKLLE